MPLMAVAGLFTSSLAAVLQNPTDFAQLRSISICSGNVQVQQDPRFAMLLPYQAQELPVDYCASWPIWVVRHGGKTPVTRVPMPADDTDLLETYVPPATFEQLWLPEDLPPPVARPAIALVLRNGEPRYIFPTVDTFLETEGVTWRNRGLFTVPLGKTWLHFGESPADSLRLSAYVQPPADESAAEEQDVVKSPAWEPSVEIRLRTNGEQWLEGGWRTLAQCDTCKCCQCPPCLPCIRASSMRPTIEPSHPRTSDCKASRWSVPGSDSSPAQDPVSP